MSVCVVVMGWWGKQMDGPRKAWKTMWALTGLLNSQMCEGAQTGPGSLRFAE